LDIFLFALSSTTKSQTTKNISLFLSYTTKEETMTDAQHIIDKID